MPINRLISPCVWVLAVTGLQAAEPAAKPTGDLAALIGTWEIKAFTDDRPDDTRGLPRLGVVPAKPGQPQKLPKLVCTGEEMIVVRANGKREVVAGLTNCGWGKFSIDEKATPKTIDLWLYKSDPAAKDQIYKGIYEIDGKTLKICWGETSPKRPTKIETTDHNNVFVCEKLSDTPELPDDAKPAK